MPAKWPLVPLLLGKQRKPSELQLPLPSRYQRQQLKEEPGDDWTFGLIRSLNCHVFNQAPKRN